MSAPASIALAGPAEVAAAAWADRWRIELEAEARFARLADGLARSKAPTQLISLARRAAADEARHADRCAAVAEAQGHPIGSHPPPPPEVAPGRLPADQALTYEIVAASCVAETLSVAVLTALLTADQPAGLRALLRELAADEVGHARLGWACLARRGRAGSAFLGPLLPGMLRGSIEEELFAPGGAEQEAPSLRRLGVLPRSERRRLLWRTLEAVIFPGLEAAGVDTSAGRAWLDGERR